MNKKIEAVLSFKDNKGNQYNFLIKNYQGYTYVNKTKALKFYIDENLCVCRDIKPYTIKATPLKEKIKK